MLSKLLLNFCHNLSTPPLRYFVLLWSFSSTINNCGTFRFYMRIFLVASLVCCSHCNTAQSAMSLSIFPPWGSRKGDNYCDKDGVDDIDGRSMNIHIPSLRLTERCWWWRWGFLWWWRWGWWLYDIDGRCHYYDTQENLGCTLGDWWEHFFLFCSITKT